MVNVIADPELAPVTPAPVTAEPESKADPEVKESEPEPKADPLQSASAKLARIAAGEEAPELALTPAELRAHSVYQQTEAANARAQEQAQAEYTRYVAELEKRHDLASANIETRLIERLEEDEIDLPPSVRRDVARMLKDEVGDLKKDATTLSLEPITASERMRLVGTLVLHGLMSQAAAQRLAAALPLVGAAITDDSIIKRIFNAGIEVGRRPDPKSETVSLSKKDYEAAIAKARKDGEDSVKAATGGRGLPAGGAPAATASVMTAAEYQRVTVEDLKDPEIRRRYDVYEKALYEKAAREARGA